MANARNYSSIPDGTLNITGKILKKYRKEFGISRQVLSNNLILIGVDISANSIYDIEQGTRTVADFEICAIAKVLKLPVQDLLNHYYNSLDNVN